MDKPEPKNTRKPMFDGEGLLEHLEYSDKEPQVNKKQMPDFRKIWEIIRNTKEYPWNAVRSFY